MVKLDKSKPYGEIGGRYDEKPNARFTQDGKFFDVHGALIMSDAEIAAEEAALTEQLAALKKAKKTDDIVPPADPVVPAAVDLPPVTPVEPEQSVEEEKPVTASKRRTGAAKNVLPDLPK